MADRSWITVFIPTPLIFRYHLPLRDNNVDFLFTFAAWGKSSSSPIRLNFVTGRSSGSDPEPELVFPDPNKGTIFKLISTAIFDSSKVIWAVQFSLLSLFFSSVLQSNTVLDEKRNKTQLSTTGVQVCKRSWTEYCMPPTHPLLLCHCLIGFFNSFTQRGQCICFLSSVPLFPPATTAVFDSHLASLYS